MASFEPEQDRVAPAEPDQNDATAERVVDMVAYLSPVWSALMKYSDEK